MKKIILGAVLAASTSITFAADSGPGCGLGSQVFNGQSGVVPHVLGATTNGTSGNQTFGMTSGTSGCDTSNPVTMASLYLDKNIDKVAVDMSKGDGEALKAFADLLEISESNQVSFASLIQDNYASIFPSQDVHSQQVMDAIVGLMQGDAELAKYVS